MYSTVLNSGMNPQAINKLFASQATPVNEILDRGDVATYLRHLTDSSKIPKNVILFVERHMPKLLLAAQQKPVTGAATNGASSSIGSSAASSSGTKSPATMSPVSNSMTTERNGKQSLIAANNDATSRPSKEDQAAQTSSSCAAGATHGTSQDTSGDKDRPRGAPASLLGGNDDEDEEAALARETQELNDLEMRSANATSLLYVYLTSPDCSTQAIDQIVPVSLAALAHPGALNPAVSLCVQRLLLAAFDHDFIKTTEAIAATLDEDLVRGTIDNLSQSSVVAETLIAIFGSALPASFMMAPTTKTELFTSAWIHYKFVDYFCADMPIAIAQRSRYNYFYFFREVLKRGFSHTAGPIADVLLRDEFFAPMLDVVISTCEDDARLPVPSKTSENSSLAPEAMAVMALIVGLLRRSIILPETEEMYATTTDYIAPLRAVSAQKHRLVKILSYESTSGAALVASNTLGLTRLSVCELFTELSLYQLASTDTILVESGFFPAFLQLCDDYADHDTLARLLHKLALEAFTRPVLLKETLTQAKDRDILMKWVIDTEEAFLRGERGDSPIAAGALFSSLFYFASAERMRYAPMATFSIDVLTILDTKPYFAEGTNGPLSHLLTKFREHAGVKERVDAMHDLITGDKFRDVGSANTPPVRHRPIVNHVGDRLVDKLSISSSSGELDVGSPIGWGSSSSASTARDDACDASGGTGAAAGKTGGGTVAGATTGRDGFGSANTVSSGDYGTESHTNKDVVRLDMNAIAEEVNQLRAAGSPQLQAYPSFRSMQLTFRGDEANSALECPDPVDAAAHSIGSHATRNDGQDDGEDREDEEDNEDRVTVEGISEPKVTPMSVEAHDDAAPIEHDGVPPPTQMDTAATPIDLPELDAAGVAETEAGESTDSDAEEEDSPAVRQLVSEDADAPVKKADMLDVIDREGTASDGDKSAKADPVCSQEGPREENGYS